MSAFMFYMHDGPKTFRFELSGTLAGIEVGKLEQAWKTASSTIEDKVLAIDISFLKAADDKGRDLLFRWYRNGAHFIANSGASQVLFESLAGRPYAPADAVVGPTFDPRFTAGSLRAALLATFFLGALLFPPVASANDESSAVLDRYSATLPSKGRLDTSAAAVEIEASMPKLDKQARVEAIRRFSAGKKQYQFIAVEGDRLVRNEMIARYFAIDTDAAPLAAPINKSNYKFHFVTVKGTGPDAVTVFQITPRRKRHGMIAGEIWIDANGAITHLSGRLVKNPSIMLRHLDISQEIEMRGGETFARETHLLMDTRIAGRAEITIREHTYAPQFEVTENVTP